MLIETILAVSSPYLKYNFLISTFNLKNYKKIAASFCIGDGQAARLILVNI